jgi:hypothetical protein
MSNQTATVDANHPDGADPNGDGADPSKPMATTDTAPTVKTRKRTKYEDAGVGELRMADGRPYLNETNGRFHVGRDATLKRDLVARQLDFEAKQAELPEGERTDPTSTPEYQMLAKLEWLSSLEASQAARANRANRKAAKAAEREQAKAAKDAAKANEPTVDRIEQGKANKQAAHATVDKVVVVGGSAKRPEFGRVLRVRRSVEDDITSPWIAVVGVPTDQRNPEGDFTEVEKPVTELQFA